MKQLIYFFLCLFYMIAPLGCTKWVSVPPPTTQVTASGAFSNDATAEAAVNGLYSQIMQGNLVFLNGGTTLYPSLSADELYGTLPDANRDGFTANALSSRNGVIAGSFWAKAYSYIYQMNACLEGISSSAAISEGAKAKLSGELLFMRGLSYFYLVNLFGPVPLEVTPDYITNKALPRTDTAAVYDQISTDLAGAEASLRRAGSVRNPLRPSADACLALQARVALYLRRWAEAKAKTDTLINSGTYTLDAPDRVFVADGTESIFSLAPVIPGINTSEGLNFIPYDHTVIPTYALTPFLLSSFESGDARKSAWLDSVVLRDSVYYYPFKYKVRGTDLVTENNLVLRLAELYLIRAEAAYELGDNAHAIADVNTIRARADLPPLANGIGGAELLSRIRQENRIEFFAEWGHRWLDLKRTGEADTVLGLEKGSWRPTSVLYPVPYSEILLNPNLTQNAEY